MSKGNYVLAKDGHHAREVYWREGNTPRCQGSWGPGLSKATPFATERGAERHMGKLSRKERASWEGVRVLHLPPA